MSLGLFISGINEQIGSLFQKWPGCKIHGLAQSVTRESGTKPETLPALVDDKGEGQFVGMDDKHPVIIYHKAGSVASSVKPNSNYGDSSGDIVNTYSMTMIVFIDRKKISQAPDDIVQLLQTSISDRLKIKNFKSVIIRIQNIILNTQQVFAGEYQNTQYKIKPSQSLFAINYQIESTFDKRCFAKCP
jgi:hypothetical protein